MVKIFLVMLHWFTCGTCLVKIFVLVMLRWLLVEHWFCIVLYGEALWSRFGWYWFVYGET